MATRLESPPAGRPLIIPVFIPHLGCPHQCVFCNQRAITGMTATPPTADQIRAEVGRFLSYGKKRHTITQISFFGGSFLGLDKPCVTGMLEAATSFVRQKTVHSLRFSTRPDTIRPHTLAWIAPFPVSTVELGVQSMNNQVLEASGRGHTAADTLEAAAMLKQRGYQLGLQMMVGLPEDDAAGAMQTARHLADLAPDFIRIYPTLVLKGSPLAAWFRQGRYRPLTLASGVTLAKQLYLFFRSRGIPVIRMGLQASDGLTETNDLIAGPYHPAFGHLVHGEIALDAIASALRGMERLPDPLPIATHPTMISRVQGLNKQNIRRLKSAFDLKKIVLHQDQYLARDLLMVANQAVTLP